MDPDSDDSQCASHTLLRGATTNERRTMIDRARSSARRRPRSWVTCVVVNFWRVKGSHVGYAAAAMRPEPNWAMHWCEPRERGKLASVLISRLLFDLASFHARRYCRLTQSASNLFIPEIFHLMRWLQLRFDGRSTGIRLKFTVTYVQEGSIVHRYMILARVINYWCRYRRLLADEMKLRTMTIYKTKLFSIFSIFSVI